MSEELAENIVEITDEDGETTKCEIYDIIDFEEKTYALLMPLNETEDEEQELIVMAYVEEEDGGYFQSIDNEDEFNRVCDYIQSLEEDDDNEE